MCHCSKNASLRALKIEINFKKAGTKIPLVRIISKKHNQFPVNNWPYASRSILRDKINEFSIRSVRIQTKLDYWNRKCAEWDIAICNRLQMSGGRKKVRRPSSAPQLSFMCRFWGFRQICFIFLFRHPTFEGLLLSNCMLCLPCNVCAAIVDILNWWKHCLLNVVNM